MKLYRVDYHENYEGNCIEWHGTKAAAESAARKLRNIDGVNSVKVEPVQVPGTKAALIDWLNAYLGKANG